jgi:hypothetical protein
MTSSGKSLTEPCPQDTWQFLAKAKSFPDYAPHGVLSGLDEYHHY